MSRVLFAAVLSTLAAFAGSVVHEPIVNMYSKPTADADVVSQARFGENVRVAETDGSWARIVTPDGYYGWVLRSTLTNRETPYSGSASVSSLFAHLYREKSIVRHAPMLTVPFETRLAIQVTDDERWMEATLPDGRTAWVQRGDLRFDSDPLDSSAVLELSRRFLGLPYTWGGTSSFGYDCSGFTQMLLRQRGILMPRDAHQQAAWEGVREVQREDLEPGDLLFFGPLPEKITHTGIYLGTGEFIHATAQGKPVVQISRLDEEHWTKTWVGTRRPK